MLGSNRTPKTLRSEENSEFLGSGSNRNDVGFALQRHQSSKIRKGLQIFPSKASIWFSSEAFAVYAHNLWVYLRSQTSRKAPPLPATPKLPHQDGGTFPASGGRMHLGHPGCMGGFQETCRRPGLLELDEEDGAQVGGTSRCQRQSRTRWSQRAVHVIFWTCSFEWASGVGPI